MHLTLTFAHNGCVGLCRDCLEKPTMCPLWYSCNSITLRLICHFHPNTLWQLIFHLKLICFLVTVLMIIAKISLLTSEVLIDQIILSLIIKICIFIILILQTNSEFKDNHDTFTKHMRQRTQCIPTVCLDYTTTTYCLLQIDPWAEGPVMSSSWMQTQ